MVKVLNAFLERNHNFKRYDIGDEYPDDDADRVEFLSKSGFLEQAEKPKRRKKGADSDGDPDT